MAAGALLANHAVHDITAELARVKGRTRQDERRHLGRGGKLHFANPDMPEVTPPEFVVIRIPSGDEERFVTIRRARVTDVDAIAAAHLDSIHSIGPQYYDADVVRDWGAHVKAEMYLNAMARGEVFYIAVGDVGGGPQVLGFSSHAAAGNEHRTAVYARGTASRLGIGSALFRAAEADAVASGAGSIHVDASLAAVDFYKAHGFEEIGRGEHRLTADRTMPCVFMRKNIAAR